MEEYSPKFNITLDQAGYSSENLPPNIPEEIEGNIRHLEGLIDKYEIAAEKGKSKLANDLLEKIEELDALLIDEITEFIESQEEEDEETPIGKIVASPRTLEAIAEELKFSIIHQLANAGKKKVSKNELLRLKFPKHDIKSKFEVENEGEKYQLKAVGFLQEYFIITKLA